MKQLKVTVNGTTYDVMVEEVGEVAAAVAPVATPAPAAAPAPVAAPAPAEGENICAPMPGTVLSVNVSAGQTVKKGDVLCVLEAMKMENEIYAPRDGSVASVNTTKGESVESGKVLVVLQ
jgi:biotin carboxyl carrier protein